MIIKLQKARKNLAGRLATDYYLYNEKVYGGNPFRRFALSKCSRGEIFGPILAYIDKNYEMASIQTDNAMNNPCFNFLGLYYKDTDHLIAHTSLQILLSPDDKLILEVGEIFINAKEELMGMHEEGSIDFVFGIYREMIKYIEKLTETRDYDVERIDLISLAEDGDFWEVTKQLGFDVEDSGDLPGRKIRFSKYKRERAITRERGITSK